MKRERRLATILKKARLRSGLTQGHIAQVLGYGSPQFVSNWERDLSLPPLKKLGKIAQMLSINPSDILDAILDDQRDEVCRALGLKKTKSRS